MARLSGTAEKLSASEAGAHTMDEQGIENAAILLMSLGEEEAAEVFKQLEPKEVQYLGETIAKLKTISRERINKVLDRFSAEATEVGTLVATSSSMAEPMKMTRSLRRRE